MKRALFVLLLMAPIFLFAQGSKMELFELYDQADVVATGEITAVKGGAFTFQADEVWKGTAGKTLEVERFRNTKTERRWGKYAEGERVLLFLKEVEGEWQILGANGEGEKLMMTDKVYVDSRGEGVWNRFAYFPVVEGVTVYAEELDPKELRAALEAVAGCYATAYEESLDVDGNPMQILYTTRSCDEAGLDAARAVSEMGNELTNRADRLMR